MRLVSHNVFWCQGVPFDGDQPGAADTAVLAGLVEVYRELRPDVLCVQEVQDETVAERIAGKLGLTRHYTPGGRYAQYGGAVLSRWPIDPASRSTQRLGGQRRVGAGDRMEQGVELCPDGTVDRVVQRVCIRTSQDPHLRLTHVHLPSNRQRGPVDGPAERIAELAQLVRDDSADPWTPHVILGDFNEPPDGPCARHLERKGYVDAARADGQEGTSSSLGRKRGDQIWLAPEAAGSLQRYLVVGKERLAGRHPTQAYLSDHLPVAVDLSTAAWA